MCTHISPIESRSKSISSHLYTSALSEAVRRPSWGCISCPDVNLLQTGPSKLVWTSVRLPLSLSQALGKCDQGAVRSGWNEWASWSFPSAWLSKNKNKKNSGYKNESKDEGRKVRRMDNWRLTIIPGTFVLEPEEPTCKPYSALGCTLYLSVIISGNKLSSDAE